MNKREQSVLMDVSELVDDGKLKNAHYLVALNLLSQLNFLNPKKIDINEICKYTGYDKELVKAAVYDLLEHHILLKNDNAECILNDNVNRTTIEDIKLEFNWHSFTKGEYAIRFSDSAALVGFLYLWDKVKADWREKILDDLDSDNDIFNNISDIFNIVEEVGCYSDEYVAELIEERDEELIDCFVVLDGELRSMSMEDITDDLSLPIAVLSSDDFRFDVELTER